MADAAAIAAAVTGLQTAFNITKGLLDLKTDAKVREQAVKLYDVILKTQADLLATQASQFALADEIRSLKEQMVKFETWNREKERYELTSLPPGVFVYTVKEDARGSEPPHKLCANCFEKGKKSILNSDEPFNGRTRLHCPSCKWEDNIGHFRAPQINRGPRGGGWGGRGGGNDWMGS